MVGRMPVVSRERLRLREILQGCQYESGVSQWIKKLKDVYESSEDPAAFFSDLTHYLSFALTKEERSKYVNRVLEVVCQFGASFLSPPSSKEKESGKEGGSGEEGDNDDEEDEDESGEELPLFLSQLFHWLLDHHAMEGLMARLRVCLMLNRLLKLMGENATILEDLFQKIYDNMQERLQDRVAAIRGQAVTALQRLQDPSDTACPIIKAFVFHLCADPSPLVRKAVIQCIAVTKSTLAHVIRRTKDFDDSVRLATYKTISAKVHVRSMTIAQREDVLKRGLKDTSPQVREVVKKDIIQAWLRHSKEDILKLLYVLDVENSNEPELADATLDAIFEGVPNAQLLQKFSFFEDGGGRLIPVEKISLEIVVYWRNLLKKFHADGDEDHVELIVPELSVFCKYVRSFVMESMKDMDHHEVEEEDKMGTQVLILKQFILMMKFFDLSDE
ncbi:NonSMC condensin I complex_ subunit G putorius, partial [Caligus rogercresseyi]